MIEDAQLLVQDKQGRWFKAPTQIAYVGGRIEFPHASIALKDEIKAMEGSKWHGFDDPPRKLWSVKDTPRNRFQLAFLKGEDVYAHFDRPLERRTYRRALMTHQRDLADHFLTYHFGVMAAEMGCGKTLSLQEIMERGGVTSWWWIGPKQTLVNIEREFVRWNLDPSVDVTLMSYEQLVKRMKEGGHAVPGGVIFDEASKLKNHSAQRSLAAQQIADAVRAEHGLAGYVILASGTPSPKVPSDWWSLAEIAYPGYLKEGSEKALRKRLAIMERQEAGAGVFEKLITWRDDDRKCDVCGDYDDAPQHDHALCKDSEQEDLYHKFAPTKNEVAYLHERLKGLVVVKHKKDVLAELPAKRYRKVYCKPAANVLQAGKAIAASAPSAVAGFTLLRELSDGFQYRQVKQGTVACTVCDEHGNVKEWVHPELPDQVFTQLDLFDASFAASLQPRDVMCPHCQGTKQAPKFVRETVALPCPKDAALREQLEENEEVGRIVIFAGFTGSIDRVRDICIKQKWSVVQVDGRGMKVFDETGMLVTGVAGLEWWSDVGKHARVAWVAHPESGGMGFTLVEARTCVFWSNSYKPEFRAQAEDRIHRPGMDENAGCTIVDLIHLPSDEAALATLQENRRLELMTMGELTNCFATAA